MPSVHGYHVCLFSFFFLLSCLPMRRNFDPCLVILANQLLLVGLPQRHCGKIQVFGQFQKPAFYKFTMQTFPGIRKKIPMRILQSNRIHPTETPRRVKKFQYLVIVRSTLFCVAQLGLSSV